MSTLRKTDGPSASSERPLGALLADLGERTPAPGGGAAAAWTGAIAAALLQMAAAFAQDDAAAERARELRTQLLDDGERDLTSYAPVLEALRRPHDDPGRKVSLRAALQAASEAPASINRHAAEVARLAHDVAARSKPALRGDAQTAATLADAASRSAAGLVAANEAQLERVEEGQA